METYIPNSGQGDIEELADEIIRGRSEHRVVCDGGTARPVREPEELPTVKADDLDKMELEPPMFIVRELLPIGLTIIASPPKYGKSWMALDLCLSVASGTEFLGHETEKADVLYLALEDSRNRLQERQRKILGGREAPGGLAISIEAEDLGHGLIEQLEKAVEGDEKIKLIVIDTFQRIRADASRGENAYAVDYREAGQIKSFADAHKLALVLIHHTRKMRDPGDPFANVSGTTGLTGASDTMWVLTKESREDEETRLSITGRDVESQEYQIQFNKESHRWHILGTTEDVEKQHEREDYESNPIVATIKKLLAQGGQPGDEWKGPSWTGTASEIISASKYFKTPIYDNANRVGRMIDDLSASLFRYDEIVYTPLPNGTGGRKHRFRVGANPFDDESKDA